MLTTHIVRREAGEPDFFISSYFSQRVPLVECNLCRRQLQRLIKYRDNPDRTARWDYKLNIVSVVENCATFVSILGSLISLWYGVDPGLDEEPRPTLLGMKKKMLICLQWEIASNAIQSKYKLSGMLQLAAWLVSSWGHDSNMAVTGGACKQQSESEAFKAYRLFVSEEN